jgi:hypothetical protein
LDLYLLFPFVPVLAWGCAEEIADAINVTAYGLHADIS